MSSLHLYRPGAGGRGEWSRRDALRVGALAPLGLTLPGLAARGAPGEGGPGFGRARACVLVYLFGGPSHLDMWDPKPDAPADVRGEFRSIATAAPGVRVCEHLPRLAATARSYCLL